MRPSACLCRLKNGCAATPNPYIASGAKRRFLSTSRPRSVDDVSTRLREVMRNVPQVSLAPRRPRPSGKKADIQPVAIVTARNTSPASSSTYHGATLTSFTSLTLHPHPLVAFSLRLPSRLADCLRPPLAPFSSPSPLPVTKAGPARIPLTVSLLSRANQPIADALSSRLPDQSSIFARSEWAASEEGDPPALREAIGALRCEVVSSIPLRDVCEPEGGEVVGREGEVVSHQMAGSELFICRVLDVVDGVGEGVEAEPLLHLKQAYVGVKREVQAGEEGS